MANEKIPVGGFDEADVKKQETLPPGYGGFDTTEDEPKKPASTDSKQEKK
jgi:hypothetical protein